MRALLRLVLFAYGLGLVALVLGADILTQLAPTHPVSHFASSQMAWAIALPSAFVYSGIRALCIMRAGGRLRTCELLIACFFGSLLAMVLTAWPNLDILPPGGVGFISSLSVLWVGISLMWMQTFSGRHSAWVYKAKDILADHEKFKLEYQTPEPEVAPAEVVPRQVPQEPERIPRRTATVLPYPDFDRPTERYDSRIFDEPQPEKRFPLMSESRRRSVL